MTPVNKDIKYIDSFTNAFLQGQGFNRNEQAGCVVYSLYDLGTITLRPLEEDQTDITFSYPFRPQKATDLEIQRRLGTKKAANIEVGIMLDGGEYPQDVKQMFEEVFQERLTIKKNLQNNYWAQLNRELSSPPVTAAPVPPYKEVNLPTTKEIFFDYLKDRFTPAQLYPFWREGAYINGVYKVYEGEESQKATEYYLRLQNLTPQQDGALVMGEFLRRSSTPPALKDQPNIVFASNDDVITKTQWVFSFRFIQLDEKRIQVRGYFSLPVIFENNELLLTDVPHLWEAIWKKIFEDYHLNEDGTPAEKNGDDKPAGVTVIPGGRPTNEGYDWAFQRIDAGEAQYMVFKEWSEKYYKDDPSRLADAYESFKKAMSSRRRKREAGPSGGTKG